MISPNTYASWVECLKALNSNDFVDSEVYEALTNGSLAVDSIKPDFLNIMVEEINTYIDTCTRKFIRGLNESLESNDFVQIELLFTRLSKKLSISLFFENLDFLPKGFKDELSDSVRSQSQAFWNDTVRFLQNQLLEGANSDLEDVLFSVSRMKLFNHTNR